MDVGDVVVVGGGQAGFQVCVSLRDNGFTGKLTLVCGERVPPYQRPPLSKSFLYGDADLPFRPDDFYPQHRIDVVERSATGIDRIEHKVHLDDGRQLPYHRLVLATGAYPRLLNLPGSRLRGVTALRTLADAEILKGQLETSRRLVVIGGGFIGLEVAAAARKLDVPVTVIESLSRTMARAVSIQMSTHLTQEHGRQGTTVLVGRSVTAFDGDASGRVTKVVLDDGSRLEADLVVVGVGVAPDTELAAGAGLKVDNGVVVDEYLRTEDETIYAIGDCASYPSAHSGGQRVRLESVQNAVDHAHCAAANICGKPTRYTAVPWFWSDQYGIKLQIAGISTGCDQTVVAGDPEAGKFSVFCFRQGKLIAVESANKPADHVLARRLLAGDPDLTPQEVATPGFDLKARPKPPVG
ncbi:pyridine nucleotide-disulfide oxidoreductase [Rhizocola hellebori]|uniref:Pyridine nucleotide-disulfide oxidoreductase n=1 Tax=Rhizocola hellebori TaxID=1392758 RepID=A0A8J3QDS5_9ACTN|nr:FAD-dependent oxidoreductase [Rhizocola hellebori]GIH08177.1 pyridine nucleotide-disulfide oxidoreductase [Rhizocola hellebori]